METAGDSAEGVGSEDSDGVGSEDSEGVGSGDFEEVDSGFFEGKVYPRIVQEWYDENEKSLCSDVECPKGERCNAGICERNP